MKNDQENGITYSDFVSSLNWLEAEGYIERFYDTNGGECVRICEGAEEAVL